jgi:hypothetical protein
MEDDFIGIGVSNNFQIGKIVLHSIETRLEIPRILCILFRKSAHAVLNIQVIIVLFQESLGKYLQIPSKHLGILLKNDTVFGCD